MIVTVASVASNWPQKATPRCLRVNETIPGACSSAATPVMWRKRIIPKGLGKLKQDFENSERFSSFFFIVFTFSLYISCTPLKFHPVTKRISWYLYLQTVTSPKGPWACSPLIPSLTSDWLKWLCPPVGRYCLGKSWKLKTNALECIDDQAIEAKRFKEPKEVEDLNEEIAIKQTVQTVQISSSSGLFSQACPPPRSSSLNSRQGHCKQLSHCQRLCIPGGPMDDSFECLRSSKLASWRSEPFNLCLRGMQHTVPSCNQPSLCR